MKKADIEKNPYVTDRSWIGQGYGYKADWDSAELDDVIYIPEYGYTTEDEGWNWKIECPYTKQDFIDLAGDEWLGKVLWEGVDWQFPETLIDEGYLNDEELLQSEEYIRFKNKLDKMEDNG